MGDARDRSSRRGQSSHRGTNRSAAVAVTALYLFTLSVGCASSSPNATSGSAPGAGATKATGTTARVAVKATPTVEREVGRAYRQGVARGADGWVFSSNFALFRTDESLQEMAKNLQAIPDEWVAKGYNHVGDIDIVNGVIYAPVEQSDMAVGRQAMFRYDAKTLGFIDGVEVAQHHNSFVSVDPQSMIAYTTDYFDDDALLRYDITKGWAPLSPIRLDRKIGKIQGGDLADEAFWISTDDDHDGLYRVDLPTGRVEDIGSIGHIDGEGEGIDATPTANGLLHVISIDAAFVPVRFIEFRVGP